jgi:hypothetical protein
MLTHSGPATEKQESIFSRPAQFSSPKNPASFLIMVLPKFGAI